MINNKVIILTVCTDKIIFTLAASSERASILNLLQWTYGIVIISRRKDMINIKKVFVNPVTISLVIGLFLFITGIKLPGVINSTMAGVAALNTPAAMIVLGYYLSCVRICDLLLNPSLYLASFVRLIIIPLLTLLVLYIIPVGHGQIGMITLIAAATPVGTSTAIFAQKFGQDYERAVCMVCLSTLFSIITMPVVMYLTVSRRYNIKHKQCKQRNYYKPDKRCQIQGRIKQ